MRKVAPGTTRRADIPDRVQHVTQVVLDGLGDIFLSPKWTDNRPFRICEVGWVRPSIGMVFRLAPVAFLVTSFDCPLRWPVLVWSTLEPPLSYSGAKSNGSGPTEGDSSVDRWIDGRCPPFGST